ncbi:MAG TPA: serine/threonine-protein kinase [Glaciibacter sp.]|nr:serine/threonine-protein kinase [Glaciibacter sp.]
MARRLPSAPPNLPGFSYVRALGSGGFADVFLFEQNMPRRQVAVKVLLSEVVNDQVRQLFQAEANLMAQLSSHPSILTVFQAGVSADGRPYLVMEYCSSTLSQRYRVEPLSVAEVLRIGVMISSAVETAHRAGILHRDIKPSNILITAYGHPVLSDFGIASTLSQAEQSDVMGLSIPWSAPEVLVDEVSGSVASEVWSLGATLYSLLAGRSPFEVPGSENTSADLLARISKARVPELGRADVPPRLELILRRAMSRRPEARQHTVLELIRELQSVETDMGLAQTPLEVAVDDWALAAAPADPDDKTRITAITSVDPLGTPRRRRAPAAARARTPPPAQSGNSAPEFSATTVQARRSRSALIWSLVAAAVVVVGISGVATTLLLRQGASDIPTVSDVTGSLDGTTVVFTWQDPGVLAGDTYVVSVPGGGTSIQRDSQFTVDSQGEDRVCLTVSVNREGRTGDPSGEECVDIPEPGGN